MDNKNRFLNFIEYTGSKTINSIHNLGENTLLFFQTIKFILQGKVSFALFLEHTKRIGYESILVISFTSFFMGMVIAFSTGVYLDNKLKGVGSFTGMSVTISFVREIGPVLTALLLAGRCGSSVAAEIGTMVVTEQVDAMRTMGVKPAEYLIAPRVLAAIISFPILTFISDLIGIIGGSLVPFIYLHQAFSQYFNNALNSFTLDLVLLGFIKSLIFGIIIIFISCSKGYFVKGGADAVGQVTTQAVVTSSIMTVVFDFILTSFAS